MTRCERRRGDRHARGNPIQTPRGLVLSSHARDRMHEQGYSPTDIDFVLSFGRFVRDHLDRSACFLPQSQFASLGGDPRFVQLQELVVVLAPDGQTIVTVYERDGRFRFEDHR
jgi:hypothetical protein